MNNERRRFSLLFYLKKRYSHKEKGIIYCRITVNGKRAEMSTNRECAIERWNAGSGRAKGTKEDIRALNAYLDLLQSKAYDALHELRRAGLPITADAIKNKLTGKEERPYLLTEIIKEHNKMMQASIGKGFAKATWTKYETTLNHIKVFLKWKYNKTDINIRDLQHSFATDFEFYLRTERNIDTNTNGKYIKNLKKIVRECVVKGWLAKDPFMGYKVKHREIEKHFLTLHELNTISAQHFSIKRMELVKDLFLFSCYTGFAYVDASQLTAANIVIGMDGKKWISSHRQKTNTPSRIPLLPPALEIIEKYKDHPQVKIKGRLIPIMSNQKVNSYLKEIADACDIQKEITFHAARHTFATTVTLSNGVPIESVSKMLGHKKLQTTQIYARVLDHKISTDMENVFRHFEKSDPLPEATANQQ